MEDKIKVINRYNRLIHELYYKREQHEDTRLVEAEMKGIWDTVKALGYRFIQEYPVMDAVIIDIQKRD